MRAQAKHQMLHGDVHEADRLSILDLTEADCTGILAVTIQKACKLGRGAIDNELSHAVLNVARQGALHSAYISLMSVARFHSSCVECYMLHVHDARAREAQSADAAAVLGGGRCKRTHDGANRSSP